VDFKESLGDFQKPKENEDKKLPEAISSMVLALLNYSIFNNFSDRRH
jgi:hypothetical protein